MDFEFFTATRILFGEGALKKVTSVAAQMGRYVFLVTGRNRDRVNPLIEVLNAEGFRLSIFHVTEEPTTELIMTAVKQARERCADMVIGFGGGSVLDTGKAVSALLKNSGHLLDYLEIIGRGKTITKASAPYIAIPTTSGTGTEVTRNAVITSKEHRVKVSMRSPWMLPQVAIVDPLLTHTVPSDTTASTGLDALTQLIEPYVSKQCNPLTDGFCQTGIIRIGNSLKRVCQSGNDNKAREDMALASLFSGLALANAKLGAVHGIAGPLGGLCPIPHGVACSRLLPFVMEANIHALSNQHGSNPVLERYEKIAQWLTGNSNANWRDGIVWIKTFIQDFKIPSLSHYGFQGKEMNLLVEKAQKASSMKTNPVVLNKQELLQILENAF